MGQPATHKSSGFHLVSHSNKLKRGPPKRTYPDTRVWKSVRHGPGGERIPAQEKAVQDRLIRETQDALLDKVSLAELNMFEAEFSTRSTLSWCSALCTDQLCKLP